MGYAIGSRAAETTASTVPASTSKPAKPQEKQDADSDSEEEDLADGDLSAVQPGFMEPCKMVLHSTSHDVRASTHRSKVLIVRTDLGMSTGKIAAQ